MSHTTLMYVAVLLASAAGLRVQSAPGPAQAATSTAPDLAAIEALEQRDAAAAKINDVDSLVSLWTADGVLLQPRSEPVQGIAAIRQLLETQKKQTAAIVTLAYVEDWKERRILGDEAYEWGEMTVTAKLPDAREVTQTVFAIRVLRRGADGSWKIARAVITPGPQNK